MDRNNCGASVSNRGWWVDKSHFYGTIKALTKRRQKIMKKRIVTLMLAAMLLLLAGCSGGGEESSSTALNVVVAATYVDDSMVEGLKTELATLTDYPDITISTVAMGDSEADPMGTVAGMAKLSGMMAAGEVDVLITDADNARRYGDNGEAYIALSELFTEEELAAMSAEATGVPVLDDEGQEIGETSAACGFVLSENASALTGLVDMRIFVFANCEKTDAAKAVVNLLASME